ncbi:MAG: archaeosortase/exosortase family protein [Flavobacteriales bacterium]|nr:archaeosortase/exosortase family protein [Flavobacteriales bacterium]
MKLSLSNPFIRFIVLAPGVYLLWYLLYEFYLQPHTSFDSYIITNLTWLSEKALLFLGYEVRPHTGDFVNYVGIVDSHWLEIGAPCDGITLLSLLLVFVLAFPGPVKHKLWFLPLGLISVHLVNVARIVALVIIVSKNPESLQFHHDYTFTILVYLYVFGLWYFWINRFSAVKHPESAKAS